MAKWIARAELATGEEIEREFPYNANGNYIAEDEEQYRAECWLLGNHKDVTWYSVDFDGEEE